MKPCRPVEGHSQRIDVHLPKRKSTWLDLSPLLFHGLVSKIQFISACGRHCWLASQTTICNSLKLCCILLWRLKVSVTMTLNFCERCEVSLLGGFWKSLFFTVNRNTCGWSHPLPPVSVLNTDVIRGIMAAILWPWGNKHKGKKSTAKEDRSEIYGLDPWWHLPSFWPISWLLVT